MFITSKNGEIYINRIFLFAHESLHMFGNFLLTFSGVDVDTNMEGDLAVRDTQMVIWLLATLK